MWQAGIGITLPIFAGSRQRPRIAAARADVRAEESRRAAVDRDLETATRSRYARLTAALRIARLYNTGLLPVDRLAVESALASYRTGKVPFVSVLDAVSALSVDRATYLARLAESDRWRIALDEADPQTTSVAAPAPAAGMTSTGAATTMSSAPSMR
jgi:outer membrane protein TolC